MLALFLKLATEALKYLMSSSPTSFSFDLLDVLQICSPVYTRLEGQQVSKSLASKLQATIPFLDMVSST